MSAATAERFRHEALFYEGIDGFMASTLPFVRAGVESDESVMVAVDEEKIALLRDALGDGADRVSFVEMRQLGRNPGCIIPAWREFIARTAAEGRPARGVGEPIWPGRAGAELDECHRHEALLNDAFDDGPPWKLVCPYDTAALPAEVVAHARRTHPFVATGSVTGRSDCYERADTLAGELPPPPAGREEIAFTRADLSNLRARARAWAHGAGLDALAACDLVLAVSELAANSIRHGGGRGVVRAWREPDAFVCEVRDSGRIEDPLAGRGLPGDAIGGGRGLWLVNQLCDLVQLRSLEAGCAVRIHIGREPAAVPVH